MISVFQGSYNEKMKTPSEASGLRRFLVGLVWFFSMLLLAVLNRDAGQGISRARAAHQIVSYPQHRKRFFAYVTPVVISVFVTILAVYADTLSRSGHGFWGFLSLPIAHLFGEPDSFVLKNSDLPEETVYIIVYDCSSSLSHVPINQRIFEHVRETLRDRGWISLPEQDSWVKNTAVATLASIEPFHFGRDEHFAVWRVCSSVNKVYPEYEMSDVLDDNSIEAAAAEISRDWWSYSDAASTRLDLLIETIETIYLESGVKNVQMILISDLEFDLGDESLSGRFPRSKVHRGIKVDAIAPESDERPAERLEREKYTLQTLGITELEVHYLGNEPLQVPDDFSRILISEEFRHVLNLYYQDPFDAAAKGVMFYDDAGERLVDSVTLRLESDEDWPSESGFLRACRGYNCRGVEPRVSTLLELRSGDAIDFLYSGRVYKESYSFDLVDARNRSLHRVELRFLQGLPRTVCIILLIIYTMLVLAFISVICDILAAIRKAP